MSMIRIGPTGRTLRRLVIVLGVALNVFMVAVSVVNLVVKPKINKPATAPVEALAGLDVDVAGRTGWGPARAD